MNNQHKMFLCGSVFCNEYSNHPTNQQKQKLYIKIGNNNATRRTFNPHIFLYNFFIIYKQQQPATTSMETHFMQYYPIVNYARDYVSQEFHFTKLNCLLMAVNIKKFFFMFNCEENLLKRIEMIK